jgi:adenylate cyclase class 2
MPTEIEIKLRLDNPDALRQCLRRSGATRVAAVLETNRMFDTPERTFLNAGCGLRVREVRALPGAGRDDRPSSATKASLTFKGACQDVAPKVREELETRIDDAAALIGILGRLGLRESVRYEKRRETWSLAECRVTVDELPRLGWFAEIEGPSVSRVHAVRHDLKLDAAPLVRENYVELSAAHGVSTGAGPRVLAFD